MPAPISFGVRFGAPVGVLAAADIAPPPAKIIQSVVSRWSA